MSELGFSGRARITLSVLSAYLCTDFPGVTVDKSDALMT